MKAAGASYAKRLILTMAVFIMLLSSALVIINRLEYTSQTESLDIVRSSIRHALVTCYAVEGFYPDSVEYLVDHYGLAYDSNVIHVYYDAFASNIMPEVSVSLRGDGMP